MLKSESRACLGKILVVSEPYKLDYALLTFLSSLPSLSRSTLYCMGFHSRILVKLPRLDLLASEVSLIFL